MRLTPRLSQAAVVDLEVWIARAAVVGVLAVFVWALAGGASEVGAIGLPVAWAQGVGDAVGAGQGLADGVGAVRDGVIEIMPAEPCWMNTTAPHRVLQNCNARGDWLGFALGPWEYVTGGLMSMMIVAVLILVVWAKYRQPIYPIFIGVVMLPISFFLFPDEFLSFAVLLAAIAVGTYIWWAITRQTE